MAASKNWQLAPLEYNIDLLTTPVLFFAGLYLAPVSLPKLVLGALAWSFGEYMVHRFLFHRHFRKDHWAHHLDPRAYIGISGIYLGLVYALLLIPACWIGLESVYSGYMLGYFLYVSLHYALHRPEYHFGPIVRHLASHHNMHHQRGIEKNFGVTSPLWDFVFQTYVSPPREQAAR
jgi:sterol desaturase/sphingolipid hydroxylase (fatty acid hydroxylase superfamily)